MAKTSKNMKKNIIKLNESQLRKVIAESIEKTLSKNSENKEQLNERLSAGIAERKLRKIVAESIKKTLNEKNGWKPDRKCLYGKEERETLKFWYKQVMEHKNEFNKFCEEYDEEYNENGPRDYAELFINEMKNGDCEEFYITVANYMDIRSLEVLAREWVEFINTRQKYGYDDPVNGYNSQYFADMDYNSPDPHKHEYVHRW